MKKINEGQIFKNYKKLCEYLEEPVKTGKSKQLQLKDWNRFFNWHKEGNQFVVDKVYDIALEKVDNRGGNNTKSIQPMMDYLRMKCSITSEYQSITTWLCDQLELMNKEAYNIPYSSQDEVSAYCNRYGITSPNLYCDYVSTAKSIMKQMFTRSLPALARQDLIEYSDGFMFTYQLGSRSKGHFATDALNEIIRKNETDICNQMNSKHGLSDKLSGRQLLLIIYGKQYYTEEFDSLKLAALMQDTNAVKIMNQTIDELMTEYGAVCGYTYVNEEHPLLSYYRGFAISEMEIMDDRDGVAMEICNIVRKKTRQVIFKKHYLNRYSGKVVYPYDRFECTTDIVITERLLFHFYDDGFTDDTAMDIAECNVDLDDLFNLT